MSITIILLTLAVEAVLYALHRRETAVSRHGKTGLRVVSARMPLDPPLVRMGR
jgi:hypothetical protein